MSGVFRPRFFRPPPPTQNPALGAFAQPTTLTADYGQLTLAGQSATFIHLLGAGVGTLTLTGQAATLNASMVAGNGTLTLTGQDATLSVATLMAADYGTLTLTGQAATLNLSMVAGSGNLTLAGQSAGFAYLSDYGQLTLTGQSANFNFNFVCDYGTLTFSAQDAQLTYNPTLTADYGTLTLTGSTDTNFTNRPPDGASGNRRKGSKRKEVRLLQRTIEVEKDGRKKKVGYIDRFAPPPPPPPLELIPDWLFPDVKPAPEPIEPIETPLLGYSDPLAIVSEIEAAEDERDAMAILDQIEDPAVVELNAFLARLSL